MRYLPNPGIPAWKTTNATTAIARNPSMSGVGRRRPDVFGGTQLYTLALSRYHAKHDHPSSDARATRRNPSFAAVPVRRTYFGNAASGERMAARPGQSPDFPGLLNAHDHLHLNSIPPLPHGGPFPNSYAWSAAFHAHFSAPAVAAALRWEKSCAICRVVSRICSVGCDHVVHHDPWHRSLDSPTFPVRVLRDFGWSHSLGLGMRADPPTQTAPYGPPVVESFRATPTGQPWIIHLAEGTDAIAASELSTLEALGCVADNTVLVHGVGLTQTDIDRVIERGGAVNLVSEQQSRYSGPYARPTKTLRCGPHALGSDSRLRRRARPAGRAACGGGHIAT